MPTDAQPYTEPALSDSQWEFASLGTRFKSTIRWLSGGHQVLLLCPGPWALGMATGLLHSLFLWTVNLS